MRERERETLLLCRQWDGRHQSPSAVTFSPDKACWPFCNLHRWRLFIFSSHLFLFFFLFPYDLFLVLLWFIDLSENLYTARERKSKVKMNQVWISSLEGVNGRSSYLVKPSFLFLFVLMGGRGCIRAQWWSIILEYKWGPTSSTLSYKSTFYLFFTLYASPTWITK